MRGSRALARRFAWLAVAGCFAATPAGAVPEGFQTSAPFAFLYDFDTGSSLVERAADEAMMPASMTKLMTAAVLFEEIKAGRVKLTDEFTISRNAWAKGGAASGGSTMFARVNSRVPVADLIAGLVVQSGNDAAIAIAEGIGGTEANFVRIMNARAKDYGLARSTFSNPTGYADPAQRVTARDLAVLARHVIVEHPDRYPVFASREFTWNRIRQRNRNPLLAMDLGADGLKTGNLDESGYGLVGSAVQDGRRLIIVVNGLPTAAARADEARKLIDYGFRAFEGRELFAAGAVVARAEVFGGEAGSVGLVARGPVRALVQRGGGDALTATLVYDGPLRAPVTKGDRVGILRVRRGELAPVETALYAAGDVPRGSLVQRAMDAALERGATWLRRAAPKL